MLCFNSSFTLLIKQACLSSLPVQYLMFFIVFPTRNCQLPHTKNDKSSGRGQMAQVTEKKSSSWKLSA